jgi:DNA-binding MarR family transcriptional regulator
VKESLFRYPRLMSDQRWTPAETVPRALGHLRVALDDAYSRVSRDLELTTAQAELLCAALRPAAVGALAQLLRCDRTNVTHLVDRAVERGWVERRSHDTDRRQSLIALTPHGEQLARRFIERLEAQLTPMLANWSDKRQRAAVEMLHEVADELDRGSVDSARQAARQ